jgi:hypothetical protein
MVEFADAGRREFVAGLRDRLAGLRDRGHHRGRVPPTRSPITDRLERLATPHGHGAVSAEENEAAEASLLLA